MPTIQSLGCAAIVAAVTLVGPTTPTSWQNTTPTAPQGPAPRPLTRGHIVLVVEGDVLHLQITAAVAKADPWGGVPKGLESEFALVAVDAKGNELARVPIDLRSFETDPAKIGTPVVVNGCEVKSPRIGVLINVPVLADAVRYEFSRGKQAIGQITAAQLGELLRSPR